MKVVFLFIFGSLNFISSANANWSIDEYWDQNNSPKLKITCEPNDEFCTKLCNTQNNCEVKESTCRDCIGTSLLMTNIFEEMGNRYRSTNDIVADQEFVDFLTRGMFVSFSSKSLYNQTDSYNSTLLQAKFFSLCPTETTNSLVLFSLQKNSKILDEVKYVVCDHTIFRMSDTPEVVLRSGSTFF